MYLGLIFESSVHNNFISEFSECHYKMHLLYI